MNEFCILTPFFFFFVFAGLWIRAMARKPKNRFAGWRRYGWRNWYMQVLAPTAAEAWAYMKAHPVDKKKNPEPDGAEVVLPSDEHPLDNPRKKKGGLAP